MLTYTYALVTLTVEQKKARQLLTELRERFQHCDCGERCTRQQCFERTLQRLIRFDASSHRRNVELYLIPAVRAAEPGASALIDELDALSAASARILEHVCERIEFAAAGQDHAFRELCGAMQCYCDNLLERLDREERELFPLARRVLSQDGWFHLASQFISHSEELQRVHHASQPPARRATLLGQVGAA